MGLRNGILYVLPFCCLSPPDFVNCSIISRLFVEEPKAGSVPPQRRDCNSEEGVTVAWPSCTYLSQTSSKFVSKVSLALQRDEGEKSTPHVKIDTMQRCWYRLIWTHQRESPILSLWKGSWFREEKNLCTSYTRRWLKSAMAALTWTDSVVSKMFLSCDKAWTSTTFKIYSLH